MTFDEIVNSLFQRVSIPRIFNKELKLGLLFPFYLSCNLTECHMLTKSFKPGLWTRARVDKSSHYLSLFSFSLRLLCSRRLSFALEEFKSHQILKSVRILNYRPNSVALSLTVFTHVNYPFRLDQALEWLETVFMISLFGIFGGKTIRVILCGSPSHFTLKSR